MREAPDWVVSPEYSTIQFDATEFGITDATLDDAVKNYGDGEGFTWLAGGGEEVFKARRTSRGHAADDGTPCSVWVIETLDTSDNLKESYVIDSPELRIREHTGNSVRFELVNKTMQIILDLIAEQAVLRKSQPFRIGYSGGIEPNYHYDPTQTEN